MTMLRQVSHPPSVARGFVSGPPRARINRAGEWVLRIECF